MFFRTSFDSYPASTMKFAAATSFISLAGLVASISVPRDVKSCPEASRFGVASVVPNNTALSPGDDISISVDFTCGINTFGIVPRFLDYTIIVPPQSNNGFEVPIVLARRDFPAGATSDSFTTKIPHAFFVAGAVYNIELTNTYPTNGTDGSEVLIQGGFFQPITIST